MPRMTTYEVRTRRWTRIEYEKPIDLGIFRPGEAVELIGDQLVVSEPQGAEVYREPAADPSSPFGWRYARREVFRAPAEVRPLAMPNEAIRVANLLP
jgi:hypothetical protein